MVAAGIDRFKLAFLWRPSRPAASGASVAPYPPAESLDRRKSAGTLRGGEKPRETFLIR